MIVNQKKKQRGGNNKERGVEEGVMRAVIIKGREEVRGQRQGRVYGSRTGP